MRIEATDVPDYISKVPDARQEALHTLRALILDVAPDVDESMTYGMPSYFLGEHHYAALASQKNYMSLYLNSDIMEAHKAELGSLNCGKSCIRFRRLEQLPLDVVRTMLEETRRKYKEIA